MTKELAGQVAIITGGGGGFGRAIATRFAAEGASVTVTSRTKSQLDETVAHIESRGGRALAVAGDATNRADVARVVTETQRRLGPITVMINNAGVPGPFGPIGVVDPEEWWAAQAVHLRAPFLFISAVLPEMKERRAGCIITIASPRTKMVTPNLSAYCMGKTAQARLTELLAAEVRDYGITAFAVDPGTTVTQMAEQTINSPDAQRWMPGMVTMLRSMLGRPGGEAILERCAQRCVELAAGRHNEWNGTYIGRNDVSEEWK
ncbi:MAG TPA: SDR family oxidoreductase [Candidatus Polarisedimenticolia bacterium]|nr:SDR family oxidoreductase [Candidatus Polarisedimenticolia bacterium]